MTPSPSPKCQGLRLTAWPGAWEGPLYSLSPPPQLHLLPGGGWRLSFGGSQEGWRRSSPEPQAGGFGGTPFCGLPEVLGCLSLNFVAFWEECSHSLTPAFHPEVRGVCACDPFWQPSERPPSTSLGCLPAPCPPPARPAAQPRPISADLSLLQVLYKQNHTARGSGNRLASRSSVVGLLLGEGNGGRGYRDLTSHGPACLCANATATCLAMIAHSQV